MISYVENTRSCRRDHLFKDFENSHHSPSNKGCNCCDICAKRCDCQKCIQNLSQYYSFMPIFFTQDN